MIEKGELIDSKSLAALHAGKGLSGLKHYISLKFIPKSKSGIINRFLINRFIPPARR